MYIHIRKSITTLVLTAGAAFFFTAAQAQTASFVSSTGDNANNCTRQAPCRTLQRGIRKTAAGGELQILDSGVYGNSVTIRRSITISAVGVAATIGRITIDAPDATVVLRGLLLSGTTISSGASRVAIAAAAAVHVVGCQIERVPGLGRGITIISEITDVFIMDTIVRNNSFGGLVISTSSTGVNLVIENSRFENNGADGVLITAGQATIERSVLAGNAQSGLNVVNTGVARISNSVVTGNNIGLEQSGPSTLASRGNNTVDGNGTNVSGTITPLPGV